MKALHSFRFKKETYSAFKKLCLLQEKTATDVLSNLMDNYILTFNNKTGQLSHLVKLINNLDIKD